jgi:hypothetical protein
LLLLYSCRLYPGSAAILAASGAGETPALPGKTIQELLSRYLVQQAQALGYRPRYVSASPWRRVLRRFVEDIAWNTHVWMANAAEQVISLGTTP